MTPTTKYEDAVSFGQKAALAEPLNTDTDEFYDRVRQDARNEGFPRSMVIIAATEAAIVLRERKIVAFIEASDE